MINVRLINLVLAFSVLGFTGNPQAQEVHSVSPAVSVAPSATGTGVDALLKEMNVANTTGVPEPLARAEDPVATLSDSRDLEGVLSGLPSQEEVLEFSEQFKPARASIESRADADDLDLPKSRSEEVREQLEGTTTLAGRIDNGGHFLETTFALATHVYEYSDELAADNVEAINEALSQAALLNPKVPGSLGEIITDSLSRQTALSKWPDRLGMAVTAGEIVLQVHGTYEEEGGVAAADVAIRESIVQLAGLGGEYVGTVAGAQLGAAIGTLIFPGVGTVVLGVAGGFIGGMYAEDFVEDGVRTAYEQYAQDYVRQTLQNISDDVQARLAEYMNGENSGNLPDANTLSEVTVSTGTNASGSGGAQQGLVLGDDRYSQVLKEILKRK